MTMAGNVAVPSLTRDLSRLVGITLACGITEVVCYHDAAHIYAAIMTGNTVQLGWAITDGDLARALPIAIALGSFFVGCVIASIFRVQLKSLRRVYWSMALFLSAAALVRSNVSLRLPVELPLLAFALALQGEGVSQFSGVNLQTVVVTNNLVKFAKTLTARYINPSSDVSKVPSREEVLVPGVCWITFGIGAGLGGWLILHSVNPLIVPIGFLFCLGIRAD